MKSTDSKSKASKNLDNLIGKLSVNNILNDQELICIRGGEGEGTIGIPCPPPPVKN